MQKCAHLIGYRGGTINCSTGAVRDRVANGNDPIVDVGCHIARCPKLRDDTVGSEAIVAARGSCIAHVVAALGVRHASNVAPDDCQPTGKQDAAAIRGHAVTLIAHIGAGAAAGHAAVALQTELPALNMHVQTQSHLCTCLHQAPQPDSPRNSPCWIVLLFAEAPCLATPLCTELWPLPAGLRSASMWPLLGMRLLRL